MTKQILTEKWAEELKEDATRPVDAEAHKQKTTAQLLENQDTFLAEASNVVAGVENWQLRELRLTLSSGTSYTGVSGGMTCEGGSSEIVCTPDSAGQRLGRVGFTIDDEVGSGSFALEIVASAEGEVFTGSATGNW